MSVERELTIEAAGVAFHARQRGDDPRLLFLHGFGGDLQTWDRLWAALPDSLSALRYDLRGFGRSKQGDEQPFSHADDLGALLDTLQLAQVDLVGVSMGGSIALDFALDHPQRVRRLVLISPGLVAWEWSPAWRALWRPIIAAARAGDMAGARRLWWHHPLFETTRNSDAGDELFAAIQRFPGAQWLRDNERPHLPDVERLHLLRVPTLLLTGDRDFEDFRVIAELLTTNDCVTRIDYAGFGHLLQLEHAAECARQIGRFLSD